MLGFVVRGNFDAGGGCRFNLEEVLLCDLWILCFGFDVLLVYAF